MKNIFVAIFIILGSRPVYAQHAVTQQLGTLAAVTFPDTPKMKKTTKGFYYSFENNGVEYMASVGSWSSGPFDNFTHDLPDTAYASLVREITGFPGAKLFYKRKIKINNLNGVEYGFVSQADSMNYYRYHRALYLKNKLIIYGFNSFDSLKIDQKALNDFYAAFKVTAPDSDRSQDTIADTLFNFKALMWAAIALLAGVGIIFIIRKFAQH
jgi:hypothetical protein